MLLPDISQIIHFNHPDVQVVQYTINTLLLSITSISILAGLSVLIIFSLPKDIEVPDIVIIIALVCPLSAQVKHSLVVLIVARESDWLNLATQ